MMNSEYYNQHYNQYHNQYQAQYDSNSPEMFYSGQPPYDRDRTTGSTSSAAKQISNLFLDANHILSPEPFTRDHLLAAAEKIHAERFTTRPKQPKIVQKIQLENRKKENEKRFSPKQRAGNRLPDLGGETLIFGTAIRTKPILPSIRK